jgi:hypothetical protein
MIPTEIEVTNFALHLQIALEILMEMIQRICAWPDVLLY